jgi:hypothetical protein
LRCAEAINVTEEIIDQRGLGVVEHGKKLPAIIVEPPAHGSVPHPVVEEPGPGIELEQNR